MKISAWAEAAPSEVRATAMQSFTCWVVKGNFLFTMELRYAAAPSRSRAPIPSVVVFDSASCRFSSFLPTITLHAAPNVLPMLPRDPIAAMIASGWLFQ